MTQLPETMDGVADTIGPPATAPAAPGREGFPAPPAVPQGLTDLPLSVKSEPLEGVAIAKVAAAPQRAKSPKATPRAVRRRSRWRLPFHAEAPMLRQVLYGYAMALGMVTLIAIVRGPLLGPWMGDDSPMIMFILPVMLAGAVGGAGPAMAATVASALVASFLLLPPLASLRVDSTIDQVRLAIFAVEGGIIALICQFMWTAIHNRRDAFAAMGESEARLRAIFDQAAIGISLLDLEGRLLEVNDRLCQIVGRSRDEMLTLTCAQLTHPDDWGCNQAMIVEIANGQREEFTIEKRYQRGDGSSVWVNVTMSALHDERGRVSRLVAVVEDISARKEAEQAVRDSERTLRALIDALPAAVYTTDAEGRITHYNHAAVELSGRMPELGSDRWCVTWKLYTADGEPLPHEQCPMARALREGRPIRGCEVVAERPDGLRIPFMPYPTPIHDDEGNLIGAVNMLVDIRERKDAERELQSLLEVAQDSEERIRQLADAMPQIVWATDPGGRLEYTNSRWYEYTGREAGADDASLWTGEVHPDDRPHVLAAWEAAISTGRMFEFEHRLRRASTGEYRWHLARAVPIRDEAGRVERWFGTTTDIHDRKVWEEHQKLLIAELSHRVKNTLASVQSIASQTRRNARTLEEFDEAFSGRLRSLAQAHGLLTRSRWSGADMRDVVRLAISPHRDLGSDSVTIDGPATILPPKKALAISMMLHELATNAAKYGSLSDPEGRVFVQWKRMPNGAPDGLVELLWHERGGPLVDAPQRRGFGSSLIERTAAFELHGESEMVFAPEGLSCRIAFPLEK